MGGGLYNSFSETQVPGSRIVLERVFEVSNAVPHRHNLPTPFPRRAYAVGAIIILSARIASKQTACRPSVNPMGPDQP